jgi:hypothetical protein
VLEAKTLSTRVIDRPPHRDADAFMVGDNATAPLQEAMPATSLSATMPSLQDRRQWRPFIVGGNGVS